MISRRKFLRLPLAVLSAMMPIATAQAQGYPPEPETPAVTTDSLNKRLLFLENERIFAAITDQWQTFSIQAMWKCFRGCGMVPRQKYRI